MRKTEHHQKLQDALRVQIHVTVGLTHFVTLNTNADMSTQAAKAKLTHFMNSLKSRLFKRCRVAIDWYDIAFLESTVAGKPHWHILVKCPPSRSAWMVKTAPNLWLKQCKHGSIDIQSITHDQKHVIGYATKMIDRPNGWDNFIIGEPPAQPKAALRGG